MEAATKRCSLKTAVKELIFSKVVGLQSATLLKDECLHRYFSSISPTF